MALLDKVMIANGDTFFRKPNFNLNLIQQKPDHE